MNAPGKAFRQGISLLQLFQTFPDEDAAREWFEGIYWPDQRHCGHCDSTRTRPTKSGKPMPYWCSDCRKYFSVKTGTAMADSNIPLQKWAIAIYLCLTSLKSVSSMKLHRDLDIGQKAAWFMLHRLREAWADELGDDPFDGPIEVDETYVGGRRENMPKAKREQATGRGYIGKVPVVGAKDRATNHVQAKAIEVPNKATLIPFVEDLAAPGATVYTDEAGPYRTLPTMFNRLRHESVNHGAQEYVRGEVYTNGIESFWAMFKRAYKGTFHKLSPKHLDRYIQEFAAKHNFRDLDTLAQMSMLALGLSGKRIKYHELIADNGLPSGARE